MQPYYQNAHCTLYHGDCRDVLSLLADRSVGLVLTDPPYEAEAHTQGRRAGMGGRHKTALSIDRPLGFDAIDSDLRVFAADHLARLARRWALTFCQVEASHLWRAAYENAGMTYRRTCVWTKTNPTPQFTGDRPGMGFETFVAMHAPGRSNWNGGGRCGVFVGSARGDTAYGVHPTQKPIDQMRELVTLFSDPGDLILDPFAGSGTTLVAAQVEGRKALGVELDEKYCEIIARRLEHGDAAAAKPLQGVML